MSATIGGEFRRSGMTVNMIAYLVTGQNTSWLPFAVLAASDSHTSLHHRAISKTSMVSLKRPNTRIEPSYSRRASARHASIRTGWTWL